jgi:2-dehydro-3-deoxyglucarate aldolase/4-hydroxy-2-oxoheptanedioate aldolase
MSSLKERLQSGQVTRLFSMGRVVHPVMIDLFGLAQGYHGFWLDQEHAGLTYDQILLASVCARANDMDCFVRMAPTNYAQVTQNLEAGAGGVLAARVESAAQAEEFVTWSKFAPRGLRGMNTSGWDARYTHKTQAQFAADANRDHLVGIQIETLGALRDIEQIAAIDGVDFLFVGPSDLSQALGYLGQLGHVEVWQGIERVSKACKQHGKHWGTVPADPPYADRAVELGCQMLIMGGDIMSTRRGIDSVKTAFASIFSRS